MITNLYRAIRLAGSWFQLAVLFIVILTGCKEGRPSDQTEPSRMHYARGFSFNTTGDITELELVVHGAHRSFLLIPVGLNVPDSTGKTIIRVPVQRVIVSGTTQVPWLEALGVQDRLIGFPDPELIHSPMTARRVQAGQVRDIGGAAGMDSEQVLSMKPDLVLAYPTTTGTREQLLSGYGIPVLSTSEMEEEHPLGRAEWIRLAGLLFGKRSEADSIFNAIADRYQSLAGQRKGKVPAPVVMTGIPYGGIWFIPGGKNSAATLFRDAGFEYLWSDDGSTGILQLGFEAVYARALKADYWVGTGHLRDLDGMVGYEKRFRDFGPLRSGQLFTYSLDAAAAVPNAYFEEAVLRPDLLLQDLVLIREGAPEEQLRYYRKVR
ncbi:MAG: ABC transporter substrate-binding protein [Bacteroidota bacterium]